MKKSVNHIIYITISLLTLLLFLFFASKAFMRDVAYNKYETFKQSKTEYDVLFFGSSHVLNAVSPMQLWNDYGITSYNIGYHAMFIVPSYWISQFCTLYHRPKIAVLDILGLDTDLKAEIYSYLHTFDNFPISRTKISAVNDIFPSFKDKLEFLIPFTLYHNNWHTKTALSTIKTGIKRMFGVYSTDITKGYDLRIGVNTSEHFDMSVNKYEGEESIGMQYAKKFISYCRKNNIEPIFMFIPYSEQENLYEWRDAFLPILEKENVPFIDFTDGIVDFDIDQFDQNSHLNPSGARKITNAIGNFLVTKFNLEDHRNDKKFCSWNNDYDSYRKYILETVSSQTSFKNLLMMLNNSEVYANVTARDGINFSDTEKKLIFNNWSKINFLTDTNIDCDVEVKVFSVKTKDLICERKFCIDKIIIE